MIMQLGTFTSNSVTYTAAGDVPPSYITSDFKQTVDIDLEDDSNCYAIGRLAGTSFDGVYDGGGFSISNFSSIAGAVHGLFGHIGGATLKDITLSGTWNVTGISSSNYCAALVARTSSTNVIERIDINGTVICTGTCEAYGTLVSLIQGDTTITDITVRGNVNGVGINFCGGIIARVDSGTVVAKNLRYTATGDLEYTRPSINGGNTSTALGGVVGVVDDGTVVTLENLLFAMTGNLISLVNAGGVIGMALTTNASNFTATNLVNAMTGDISGISTGGIFGRTYFGNTSHVLNVMRGSISGSSSGGISGIHFNGALTNAIVAMNGDIGSHVGSALVNNNSGTISIEWATSDFGLTVNSSSISDVNTKPAASSPWAYHPEFPEIPYLEMSASDSEANVSYVETPFPNISGNGTIYDGTYDHYSVAFDSTFSPVEAVLGVAKNDYSLFKFDTVGFNVIESQGLGITFVDSPYSAIFVLMFAYIAYISWYGTNSVYEVTSTETGMSEESQKTTVETSTTVPVSPGTEYTFNIYGDGVLIYTTNAETTPVADGNSILDMITYLNFDITTLDDTSVTGTIEHIGDALDTNDELTVVVEQGNTVSTELVTFVDDGDTINIEGKSHILTPFSVTGGSTQSVTLELSDTSTEVVSYDESSNEVTVASQTHGVGDTFILDGKKVRVANV